MCNKSDDPTQHDLAPSDRCPACGAWFDCNHVRPYPDARPLAQRGGWVARAKRNDLPVFTTHQSAYAYVREGERGAWTF